MMSLKLCFGVNAVNDVLAVQHPCEECSWAAVIINRQVTIIVFFGIIYETFFYTYLNAIDAEFKES